MKCGPVIMFAPPALELVLFLCTIGLSSAAPHLNTRDASSDFRHPRAALETTGEPLSASTTSHLSEDKSADATIAGLTPAPTTTVAGRTATATIAPTSVPSKTTVRKNEDAVTGLVHATSASASTISLDKTTVSQRATNSLSTKDTASPQVPTTKISQDLLCNCSSEGVSDPEDCDEGTGQCSCLLGYTGLQCEDCEEGHFTNGSTGCLPCGCDSYGAVEDRCNSSGACVCKTGVFGPKCDDCHPGFFRFSSTGCRPCQCSNHSSYCHPQSGTCLDCQDNTKGPSCEECAEGFYRRPGAALTDACVACPCFHNTSTGSCRPAIGVPTPTHVTTTTTPATRTTTGVTATAANSTGGRVGVATTQALLTSLGVPTDNATTTVSEVSWAQFNVVVLAVIIVTVVLLMGAAGGAYSYREYRNRKLNAPFWTIELKEDNISFSSYHDSIPNADVSGLLEEPGDAPPNGHAALSSPRNVYKT
ncbi:multiple epidermal growth factor-like domains protein 9 isoform X2 [Conger conger]|uniref:multiple epidermal growth factor-like domains protein 9 isoform X2 n=1 Tax=Conger conger TaxID=82655 RepID=UPI002A599924|nr:multiple epidermal growth factor-like domains protein 9 isoform X2 [Conger conger]